MRTSKDSSEVSGETFVEGEAGLCGTADGMDRREETITLPGNGFDKARVLRIILNGARSFL